MKENNDTKVLIVDDETDACYLLENILKGKNIKSASAHTLSEATKVLSNLKPAIMFLDNHLEDGLGIDFIPEVKSFSPETKVVIITAQDSSAWRKEAMNKGADFFIGKPFTKNKIFEIIHEFL
ncbi:MAG: response regulator [Chitinophagaceae bacterium]